jgi:hypothetical protein
MRAAILLLLITSCTPTIDRVERHDASVTDSALSVLSTIGKDTVTLVKTRTIEKTLVKYVQSEPIRVAMVRPAPIEKRGCDTVYIRDTVYLSR